MLKNINDTYCAYQNQTLYEIDFFKIVVHVGLEYYIEQFVFHSR